MNKKVMLSLVFGLMGMATIASADQFRCTTNSRGVQFNNVGYDLDLSRHVVIDACKRDSRTSNYECEANTFCAREGFVPPPPSYSEFTCTTRSRGFEFRNTGANPDVSRNVVVDSCMRDSRTNNTECRMNVYCDSHGYNPGYPVPGPMPRPMPPRGEYLCTTGSNGITFRSSSFDMNTASSAVIGACERDTRTYMGDCRRNVRCSTQGLDTFESIMEDINSSGEVIDVPAEGQAAE